MHLEVRAPDHPCCSTWYSFLCPRSGCDLHLVWARVTGIPSGSSGHATRGWRSCVSWCHGSPSAFCQPSAGAASTAVRCATVVASVWGIYRICVVEHLHLAFPSRCHCAGTTFAAGEVVTPALIDIVTAESYYSPHVRHACTLLLLQCNLRGGAWGIIYLFGLSRGRVGEDFSLCWTLGLIP